MNRTPCFEMLTAVVCSSEKVIRKLTCQDIRGVDQLIRDQGVLDVNASKYLRKTSGALISIPQSLVVAATSNSHEPGGRACSDAVLLMHRTSV